MNPIPSVRVSNSMAVNIAGLVMMIFYTDFISVFSRKKKMKYSITAMAM